MAAFVSQSDFDFKVRLPTHSLTVKAGQPICIPVVVGTIKGKPRPVTLSTTDWGSAGVSAEVAPSTVPSGRVATLYISVSPGTAPGSYLLTVRGSIEGTFSTSSDSITITVEPEPEEKGGDDRRDTLQDPGGQESTGEPAVSPSPASALRAVLSRATRKPAARPVPAGQRAVLIAIMFVMMGVLIYYVGAQLRTGYGGSAGGVSGTYVGTSTFCIYSVMGNDPDCGTGNCSIQIDGSGNVLGPVLFGKINGNSFSGEADAGNGSTFPMTGTLSDGTLTARYTSSSVSWTITVHK